MRIIDFTGTTFQEICYRASESLMWDARQQTNPETMASLALAAKYAEQYADEFGDKWNKHAIRILRAYVSTLTVGQRQTMLALSDNEVDRWDQETDMVRFLTDVARVHADHDIETGELTSGTDFAEWAVESALRIQDMSDVDVSEEAQRLMDQLSLMRAE